MDGTMHREGPWVRGGTRARRGGWTQGCARPIDETEWRVKGATGEISQLSASSASLSLSLSLSVGQ